MKDITAFKKLDIKVVQFAPNHIVIQTKRGRAFQSYDSIVCFISTDGTVTLGKHFDYSRTTMRYLGQWLGYAAKEIKTYLKDGKYKYDEELI